jgi:hypothetical protein
MHISHEAGGAEFHVARFFSVGMYVCHSTCVVGDPQRTIRSNLSCNHSIS